MHWLRAAKEMVNKLSEPTGDRESLSSKVTQVSKLITEKTQGQQKLEEALSKAEAACKASDEEDREIVEEEAAFLQEGLHLHYLPSFTSRFSSSGTFSAA